MMYKKLTKKFLSWSIFIIIAYNIRPYIIILLYWIVSPFSINLNDYEFALYFTLGLTTISIITLIEDLLNDKFLMGDVPGPPGNSINNGSVFGNAGSSTQVPTLPPVQVPTLPPIRTLNLPPAQTPVVPWVDGAHLGNIKELFTQAKAQQIAAGVPDSIELDQKIRTSITQLSLLRAKCHSHVEFEEAKIRWQRQLNYEFLYGRG